VGFALGPLHAALAEAVGGVDELNLEGAAVSGELLRLFQRGNGARGQGAIFDLDLAGVRRALDASAQRAGSLSFAGPRGESHELAFAQIKDAPGLDWIVVVAVPRRDLMGGIADNVIRTGLIGAVASVAAVLLGLGILGWIGRDLARLADAARVIGDDRADVPLAIDRRDEIGDLADCFRQMQHKLRTDNLTGLLNRDALLKRIDERIRLHRRAMDGPSFAVLFIDIDDFKLVNDQWGHDVGDRTLIEIGKRLRATTRSADLVARYAGDEFVVVMDSVDSLGTAERAREKLEQALRQPLQEEASSTPSRPIGLSGSIGLALFAGEDSTAEDLIRRADADMYRRKAGARSPDVRRES
jgi:diguanylate cyclase (GGDEF)-like protein